MFFNRNKRISRQIASAIWGSIISPFRLTQYLDSYGNFSPPKGFWEDAYILGYVLSLIHIFLHQDFNGAQMNREKYGLIILMVFQELCSEKAEPAFTKATELARKIGLAEDIRNNMKGGTDASLTYWVVTEQLQRDGLDEKSLELIERAEKLSKVLPKLGSFGKPDIATALTMITLHKHLEANYLEGHL